MPKSKKRVKKKQEESIPVTKNPLKTTWGKVLVVVLAFGFVGAIIASVIFNLAQHLN